jgi:hypothetical protein
MVHFVVMNERGSKVWEKWQGLVSEQQASGLSVAAFVEPAG